MGLFTKTAKEKKNTKEKLKDAGMGFASSYVGLRGTELGFKVPSLALGEKILPKEVLSDLKKQEIMDYYNKIYNSNLMDVDAYVKKYPQHKDFFNDIQTKEFERINKMYFKNPIKNTLLGMDYLKETNGLKEALKKQKLPEGKKWITTFRDGVNSVDGALTTHPNFGIHLVDNHKNNAIPAHELGHLSDKWLEHPLGSRATPINNLSGFGGMYAAAKGGFYGKDMNNAELALTTAPSLPLLAIETKANLRAARAIYALRGAKGLKEALPTLMLSQGSYTALPFMPYLANKLSKKIHNTFKKNKAEKNKIKSKKSLYKTAARINGRQISSGYKMFSNNSIKTKKNTLNNGNTSNLNWRNVRNGVMVGGIGMVGATTVS